MLFSIYMDELFSKWEYLGLGCHVGLTYARAFGYADDPNKFQSVNLLK